MMLALLSLNRVERRLLARLWRAGARDAAHAHPLPELPRAPAEWKVRLVRMGLLVEAGEAGSFVDPAVYLPALIGFRLLHLGLASAALAVVTFLLRRH
jgi:hypothetical protein